MSGGHTTANDVAAWAWVLFYVGWMAVDRGRPSSAAGRPAGIDRLLDGLSVAGVTLVLLPPLPDWPLGRRWLVPAAPTAALGLAVAGLGLAAATAALGTRRRPRHPAALQCGILLAAAGTLLTGADWAALPGLAMLALTALVSLLRQHRNGAS